MLCCCFLCRYSTDRNAINMNKFIEENIGMMHPDIIAQEVHNVLSQLMDTNDGSSASLISVETIKEHIYLHTLNPVIRTGVMLRSLVDLEEKMKAELFKTDAQGQNAGLDPKRIEAYLRLQAQQMNLYRTNPTRLMFMSQQSENNAGPQ